MNNPIAWGALVLFVLGIILLLIVEGIQRQRRLDRMVFKPRVTITQTWRRWEQDSARVTLLRLNFGLPESGADSAESAVETVNVTLTFRWSGTKYYLTRKEIAHLLETVKSHGIGRKWTATQEGEFWSRVEDDVVASLLQHQASMASFAEHGVAS